MTNPRLITAANFEGIDPDAEPEIVAWSLHKLLEMQRRFTTGEGIFWIGGYGVMTAITPQGVGQRVICHWPADRVGELLRQAPIDWEVWHPENPRPLETGTESPTLPPGGGVVSFANRAACRRAERNASR